MKVNYVQNSRGRCVHCGESGIEYAIGKNGKQYAKQRFYKVFEENSVFRGDDELIGTYCKSCFKIKPWLI